ncbi:MAG TPA: hypothetical protein VEK39_05370 [Solirubrobacterales bacterium]|nr:hypothetical protein [Solirubrobacterales bacterium]
MEACSEAIGLQTALEAELWASALVGMWWPRRFEPGADDPDLEIGGPIVDEIARCGNAGALAALIAIGEVSETELGLAALESARRLIADGIDAPRWGQAILEAQVTRTAVMCEEVFDDGRTIFIEAAHGDGERHAVGVYIDNNLGMMAKDILLADSIERVEDVMRENPQDDGVLRIEPIEPAEASARVRAAIELTDMTLDAPVGEDYARLRALALLRAADLPDGDVDVDIPEISAEERDRLFESFLASPEAGGMEPGADEADVVSLAIDFCCDYVDGRALRWSPVVAELFMADWLPRKVVGDRGLFEAVPSALEAWVRFAGRERGIPDWAIARTVEAIPRWTDEMLDAAADSTAGGPAKRFLAAAKEAGVDLTDEQALAGFIAGWNARSNAA